MPTTTAPISAASLAAATPVHRDRYVDLLRAISIAVVVFGHWLVAAVTVDDGRIGGQNVLAVVPATQWLTWLLQVMPLFFLVGGFANAASWESPNRTGGYAVWVSGRLRRLLAPTAVFAGVWSVAALVARATGVEPGVVELAGALVALPLWFLAVYVGVVALAPVLLALHRRVGLALPLTLTAAAATVDLVVPAPYAMVNFLLVWSAITCLGFSWRDGRFDRRAVILAVVGLAALVALTTVGGYARSMVGVPGAARSNNAPPTIALIALGVWQLGLVIALRGAATRWLARPRVWTAVVAANGVAMTVYLWHLTAVVLVAATVVPHLPDPAIGSGSWWLLRPVWLAVLTVALVPLVALFARFERPRARRATGGSPAVAVAGVVALCAGLATYTAQGFPSATASVALAVGLVLANLAVHERREDQRTGRPAADG